MSKRKATTEGAPPAKKARTSNIVHQYAHLLPVPAIHEDVRKWLKEDIPSFDCGGHVVGSTHETAHLLGKSPGVMAGAPWVNAVFRELGCEVEWRVGDGSLVGQDGEKTVAAVITGPAAALLQGERTALNLMARCSGIATASRNLAELKEKHGYTGCVAGTRKTTPGLRAMEKYAMLVGGVDTHRMDLSSMVMLKDNHIWSRGSITAAVKEAREVCGFSMKIEVECGDLEAAMEACEAGANVVMLDNMTPETLKKTASTVKAAHPHVLIEASGGITADSLPSYFCPQVDIFSTSTAHQGVGIIDFSMKIQK